MGLKNQLTKTPYLVLFIVLISVGVGTASALITITLAGNVVVTDDLLVQGNVSVDGTIAGDLNVYTVESQHVINGGNSIFEKVLCNDNNDIALTGGFQTSSGDESSMNINDSFVTQAKFDEDDQRFDAAFIFISITNNAQNPVTVIIHLTCLDVPGTQ